MVFEENDEGISNQQTGIRVTRKDSPFKRKRIEKCNQIAGSFKRFYRKKNVQSAQA